MKGGKKQMKKLYIVSGILVIVGVIYLSLNMQTVSAATIQQGQGQGIGRQQMLVEKAKILKMNVTDLQNKINSGKTFFDIAKEKGINIDSMHEQMEKFQKTRLQTLVNQGTITKEQMQERLDFMEKRQANCGNNVPFSGQGGRGMGMNRK